MGRASIPTPALYPAFFFVLGKAAKAQETQSYQRFQHIGRTAFNTSGTNAATLVSKGCGGYTLAFANRIAHSGSQGETRGVSGGGAITTLEPFRTVRKPCAAGCQNGKLCRFWALVEGAPEERREPLGQRCAHARRCPEASRPRWNAQLRYWFLRCIGELHGLPSLRRNSGESFHAPCCADSFICAL